MTKKFDLALAVYNIVAPILFLTWVVSSISGAMKYIIGAALLGPIIPVVFLASIPIILSGLFLWIAHITKSYIVIARIINFVIIFLEFALLFSYFFKKY